PYVVDIAGSQKKKTSATHSQMSILENSVNQRNVGKLRTDQDGKIADARNRPLAPPGLDQVRKEVQANPHLTPGSILEFASHLGSKMELALKSEEQGNLVFKELEDCTLNTIDYSPVSIRAVCLSNANVLGQRYSSLQLKYQALLGKADSESIRLSYIP
ncbi:MAG: hypothetical protein ABIQ95_04050, partial [Bdellovibrionia bacterium]